MGSTADSAMVCKTVGLAYVGSNPTGGAGPTGAAVPDVPGPRRPCRRWCLRWRGTTPWLGVPAHPRRAGRPGIHGCAVDGLAGTQGRRHRSRSRTVRADLAVTATAGSVYASRRAGEVPVTTRPAPGPPSAWNMRAVFPASGLTAPAREADPHGTPPARWTSHVPAMDLVFTRRADTSLLAW
jgi:hypothetical protein